MEEGFLFTESQGKTYSDIKHFSVQAFNMSQKKMGKNKFDNVSLISECSHMLVRITRYWSQRHYLTLKQEKRKKNHYCHFSRDSK